MSWWTTTMKISHATKNVPKAPMRPVTTEEQKKLLAQTIRELTRLMNLLMTKSKKMIVKISDKGNPVASKRSRSKRGVVTVQSMYLIVEEVQKMNKRARKSYVSVHSIRIFLSISPERIHLKLLELSKNNPYLAYQIPRVIGAPEATNSAPKPEPLMYSTTTGVDPKSEAVVEKKRAKSVKVDGYTNVKKTYP